jgi:transposase
LPTIQPAPRARHSWHGGPPPTYQPRFSEAEIAQARSWACSQALPHAEVQRARLVLLLHEQPDLRSPQAARRLGQSTAWVCKWRRRWVEQGFSLQDAPRPGRPTQFPDWVWALVIAIACELPSQLGLPLSRHFASSVWQVVRAENVVISLRSVQRMLARHHLKPWRYVSWMHPRDPTSSSSTPGSGRAGAWGAAITGRFEQSTHDCPAVIRIRFHDMRHTHATLLLENGGTERQVAERLGITVEMVHETYGHVTPKMRASAPANLGAALATARARSVSDADSDADGK